MHIGQSRPRSPDRTRFPRARGAGTGGVAVVCGALGLLPACNLLSPDRATVLSSDPPGASVVIDGRDSGFATPCKLDLGADDPLRIDFELPGFRTETRILTPDHEAYAVLWHEMNVTQKTWRFPLFLNLTDFFVPVKWENTQVPSRIHVQLERSADAPELSPAPWTPGARKSPVR